MTRVTLGKVPGALALGLLAALAAHAALYGGGGHEVGGAFHALLLQGAVAAGAALAFFLGALAWNGSRDVADGSVLAARLRDRLPTLGALLSSSVLWYSAVEAAEPRHGGPAPLAALAGVALAVWVVLRIARALTDLIAGAVFAILRVSFTARTPSWHRRPYARPAQRRTACVRRRFARPPPIAFARA
jgi:hypothetical protein